MYVYIYMYIFAFFPHVFTLRWRCNAYPDSDVTAMLRAPWTTSLRCHWALGVPPATLRRVCCDATVTCFRGDLTALVLSMFKTWRRPPRLWRPYCDLQRCHGSMRSYNDPVAISGDLADFADRSEVAILCDWGINKDSLTRLLIV